MIVVVTFYSIHSIMIVAFESGVAFRSLFVELFDCVRVLLWFVLDLIVSTYKKYKNVPID